MIAVEYEHRGYNANGQHLVKATVLSNTVPETLPTTGSGISGMNADDVFFPMSVLYVVAANAATKLYIANESGEFVAQ